MTLIEKSDKYNYEVYLDEKRSMKFFKSPEYNYIFNMKNGQMISWGKTPDQDPERCPINNILDLEISTICKHGCPFCYKSANSNGKLMSFETFKKIFDVQSKGLTQIAFGSDFTGRINPDILKMMDYAREHNVIPNITVGAIDEETADEFAKRVGAIAFSIYPDSKEQTYDSIKMMTDRGIKQVNVHFMIAEETYNRCLEVLNDIKTDPRLAGLNAIVLLSLKQKGRGTGFTPLNQEKFNNLCNIAKESKIGLGFDSCSSLKSLRALGEGVRDNIIPCEAGGVESSYINVNGFYFPCSFCEGETANVTSPIITDSKKLIGITGEILDWRTGLNVLECNSTEEFLDKIWNNPKTLQFKEALSKTACDNCEHCKHCPVFSV